MKFVFYLVSLLFLLGCGRQQDSELAHIFSIIDTAKIDSAKVLLESIDSAKIVTEHDRAFYNMYNAMVCANKKIPFDDSLIDESIYYFDRTNDYRNLAQAFFYKGQLSSNNDSMALYYKKAEYNILKTNDEFWKYMVFWGLSAVNVNNGDKQLALDYAKRRYRTARNHLADKEVMRSMLSLALDYHILGLDDSARMYCDTLVSLGVRIDDWLQSIYCNLMGELCLGTDRQKALEFFEKGVKYSYHQKCWKNLSILYVEMGRNSEAESFIKATLDSSCYEIQLDMLSVLYGVEKNCGNLDNALCLAETIIGKKDSLQKRLNDCRVVEEQHRFDEKINYIEYKNKIAKYIFCIILSLLITLITILLYAYRKRGIEKKMLEESQRKLLYESKISRLRVDLKDARDSQELSQNMINELQEKLNEKELEWKQLYAYGSTLQSEIDSNKSIIMWSHDDIEDYISYYLSQDEKLRDKIKDGYSNLSQNDKLFLILETLGKTNSQISEILGISSASVRMRKFRIKGKQL